MHENWHNDPEHRPAGTTGGSDGPPPPPPTSFTSQPAPQPASQPDQQASRAARRVGWPVLVTSVALAAVLGGGVGGLAVTMLDDDTMATAETQQGSPQINRSENVSSTTEAAAIASPSVVTLSVGGQRAEGSGSGVIVDTEGHILTNNHVVTLGGQAAAADVKVQTSDGEVYEAEVVGLDPLSDLAVIKIEAEGLTPIEMGSSEDLNVGDQTIAIGAPLGLSGTVTEGILSTLNRTISVASSAVPQQEDTPEQDSPFEFGLPENTEQPVAQGQIHLNVLQSDAAINPGNSGGALLDHAGRLIGINVAIATRSEGNVGLGFAIPVDYAQRVAQEIIEHGQASHGMLGVQIVPAGELSVGARVVEVVDGGAAAGADLKTDDVIVAVDGKSVKDPGSLSATVREYSAGTDVELTIHRGEQEFTEMVTLGE